jgi:hypothetical protein
MSEGVLETREGVWGVPSVEDWDWETFREGPGEVREMEEPWRCRGVFAEGELRVEAEGELSPK